MRGIGRAAAVPRWEEGQVTKPDKDPCLSPPSRGAVGSLPWDPGCSVPKGPAGDWQENNQSLPLPRHQETFQKALHPAFFPLEKHPAFTSWEQKHWANDS